ncbi:hypothetical protein LCGC14_2324390, partial [marine sediment metagenome]
QMGPPSPPVYKHGGAVRQLRKKYEHGGKAIGLGGEELPDMTDEERYLAIQRNSVNRGAAMGDAVFGKLSEIGRANRSIMSAGPEQEAAVQGIPTDTPPEDVVPPTEQPSPAGGGAPVGGGGSPSPQAIPTAQDEEEIDFSTEAREVMPEDLPSQTAKDWEDEQSYWAASAIMEGKDPFAAMDKVKQQQQDGFTRYSMQATTLMDAGDLEGAARALYAAYQHFPNGKDVRFGIQKGKDGQRVMVAMGRDEKTGEASGPPQVIDRNTITRMVENMQKPGALRAWTTDWQAMEAKLWGQGFKRDELKEKGRHNRAMEGAYEARTAAVGAGGGMKQTDLDRAFGEFIGDQELEKLNDPDTARYLARVMSEVYQKTGGGRGGDAYSSVIEAVMAAYNDGSLESLREQYGLQ